MLADIEIMRIFELELATLKKHFESNEICGDAALRAYETALLFGDGRARVKVRCSYR